jgi:hypothetical protein
MEWSSGNPRLARRWRIADFISAGVAVVFFIAMLLNRGEFGLFLILAGVCFVAMAFESFARSRRRRYSPAPELTERGLARYKVRLVAPGQRSGAPFWLLLEDEAMYLLGRYYATENLEFPYDEVVCAQEVRLKLLGRRVGRLVRLVHTTGEQHWLATRSVPTVLGLLQSASIPVHSEPLEVSGFRFNLGTSKALDLAQHDACRVSRMSTPDD